MKKALAIIGITGAAITAIGVSFKLNHWPGAAILLLLGSSALIAYAVMFMIERIKTFSTGIGKTFAVLLGVCGILMCFGFMFKMLHYPGANVLIITFFIAYIVLLVVSLIRAINEKEQELKYNFMNWFICLLGFGIILLYPTLFNIMNHIAFISPQ